jgi:pimeloyl-ACP methyl ester carboxylesterase
MTIRIERHFVTINGKWGQRQVHYRLAGEGPPVILLHQSPKSSREYETLMTQWAKFFTVIAPDTPGFGQSDPLPVMRTTVEELADCVIEFADALSLDRFSVYGFHTGGGIAIALADAYPSRICAATVNGLVMPTTAERDEIPEYYLPAFEPNWDGSHLAWAWARMREQTVFFPWFASTLSNRMDYTMPATEALQENLREFLQSGDHYRVGYRAAFEYDATPALARLQVPTLVTAAQLDPLSTHIDRIGECADCLTTVISTDANEAEAACLELLLAHVSAKTGGLPAPQALADRAWQDTVQLESGPVRLLRFGEQCKALVLHAAAGSAVTADRLTRALNNSAAMDLPGHGEHSLSTDHQLSVTECAQRVVDVLFARNDDPILLAGQAEGAWVALETALLAAERCSGVLLLDPPEFSAELSEAIKAEGLPSMAPDWHGGHLSRAWHTVRDSRLFHPWFRRTPKGIRWIEPDLDPLRLTLEVREMLSAEGHWQALVRDALDYPAAERIRELEVPVYVLIAADNPSANQLVAWAQTLPVAGHSVLPSQTDDWPEAIEQLIQTSTNRPFVLR